MTLHDFLKAIRPGGQCIQWPGYLNARGYGSLYANRTHGVSAHRESFRIHVGEIPAGMTVDHTCFNPACVNPRHLRLLSHSDNCANQREAHKDRCIHGHEFTPENTYFKPGFRNGRRTCRACQRAVVARYKARKKEQA